MNWISQLPGKRCAHQYLLPGGGDSVVRIFYLDKVRTWREFPGGRGGGPLDGGYPADVVYNALKAVTLRATSGQAGMAEWMIHELDQPDRSAAAHEYRLPGDLARVFYLTYNSRRTRSKFRKSPC